MTVFVLCLAVACPPAPGAKEIHVSVLTIVASSKGHAVDPKLECLAKEVQKGYPHLTNFRLAKVTCKDVAVGQQQTFELVEKHVCRVTILQVGDKARPVEMKADAPELGAITYETACGKYFPLVTKARTDKDETIIVAIRVQPCGKK